MSGAGPERAALAGYVRAMGRGPGRARNLERGEAAEAMRLILSGAAAPEAVGALLMLMRYRGETADEIAGFVDAMREPAARWREIGADLDWPSYAAGRSRGVPWFLLSARLAAAAGLRVAIHGWNAPHGGASDVRAALARLGIPIACDPGAARAALDQGGVVYLPLEDLDARLLALLRLRDVLGLRSPVNTALRAFNPTGAPASVQGVFHPPYLTLQQQAGARLGLRRLLVLKGGGGEFERHPGKISRLRGLSDGAPIEHLAPALMEETRRLADPDPDPARLAALWAGAEADPFAEAVAQGTAALALLAAGRAEARAAEADAAALWRGRDRAALG